MNKILILESDSGNKIKIELLNEPYKCDEGYTYFDGLDEDGNMQSYRVKLNEDL